MAREGGRRSGMVYVALVGTLMTIYSFLEQGRPLGVVLALLLTAFVLTPWETGTPLRGVSSMPGRAPRVGRPPFDPLPTRTRVLLLLVVCGLAAGPALSLSEQTPPDEPRVRLLTVEDVPAGLPLSEPESQEFTPDSVCGSQWTEFNRTDPRSVVFDNRDRSDPRIVFNRVTPFPDDDSARLAMSALRELAVDGCVWSDEVSGQTVQLLLEEPPPVGEESVAYRVEGFPESHVHYVALRAGNVVSLVGSAMPSVDEAARVARELSTRSEEIVLGAPGEN